MKLSAFDYAFISYNISSATNQVINRVTLTDNLVINSNENIPEIKFIVLVLGCQFLICCLQRTKETIK
jgi:subtilase family serine protease